ncbi:MAG: ribonuclease D [Leptospiraceae bacterium]|nr:ribonuclease D [Leptospiraceae bacterium]MDW7975010.1 ribonuclease D [Leptospiraceae bacterium]
MNRAIVFKYDIPEEVKKEFEQQQQLAVDCEMMGLNPYRDRLCLIQIASENGTCAIVQIDEEKPPQNVKSILENEKIEKIFHFARSDILFLKMRLDIQVKNIYCTKIASRLARTYTDKHGLKEIVKEFFGETLDKTITSTDWGNPNLTDEQLLYAQNDVIYLFEIKRILNEMLKRENRYELFLKAIDFLPTRLALDMQGFVEDIYSH